MNLEPEYAWTGAGKKSEGVRTGAKFVQETGKSSRGESEVKLSSDRIQGKEHENMQV